MQDEYFLFQIGEDFLFIMDTIIVMYLDKAYSCILNYYVCLQFQNAFYGDARGKARRLFSCLQSCVPGIMNPHTIVVQRWNRFFVISCLLAIFVDPLFFLLLSVQQVWFCFFLDVEVLCGLFFKALQALHLNWALDVKNGFDKIIFLFISLIIILHLLKLEST